MATIVCAFVVVGPGLYLIDDDQAAFGGPLAVIGFYLLAVIGFYFSVGLAAAADMIFRGQRGDRRRRARGRAQPLLARSPAGRRSRPRSASLLSALENQGGIVGQIVGRAARPSPGR